MEFNYIGIALLKEEHEEILMGLKARIADLESGIQTLNDTYMIEYYTSRLEIAKALYEKLKGGM